MWSQIARERRLENAPLRKPKQYHVIREFLSAAGYGVPFAELQEAAGRPYVSNPRHSPTQHHSSFTLPCPAAHIPAAIFFD
jgi:hypothetical protein